MSNPTDTDAPLVVSPAQADALRALSPREIRALATMAAQEIAFADYEPDPAPRVTLRVVDGGEDITIPCPMACEVSGADGPTPCRWARRPGGVVCNTAGCAAWAHPGMELHDKVVADLEAT